MKVVDLSVSPWLSKMLSKYDELPVFVQTHRSDGNMNTNPAFFSCKTRDEAKELFMNNRIKLAEKLEKCGYIIDPLQFYMADQDMTKDASFNRRGTSFIITKDYIDKNPFGWGTMPQDMASIKEVDDDTRGVVIGSATADCPTIFGIDPEKNSIVSCHCDATRIDSLMPMEVFDRLQEMGNWTTKDDHLLACIAPCAGIAYSHDKYPDFVKNEAVWKDAISRDPVTSPYIYHTDMRKAIYNQLLARNINPENIIFDLDDTITDPNYYSHHAAKQLKYKKGRHFAGMFYPKKNK